MKAEIFTDEQVTDFSGVVVVVWRHAFQSEWPYILLSIVIILITFLLVIHRCGCGVVVGG